MIVKLFVFAKKLYEYMSANTSIYWYIDILNIIYANIQSMYEYMSDHTSIYWYNDIHQIIYANIQSMQTIIYKQINAIFTSTKSI